MRTLISPIHAPGTYVERSRRNKHGLPNALRAYGEVVEFDYLSVSANDLDAVMRTEIDLFRPDLLFLQIQGATPITAEMLAGWRASYSQIHICNWSGDYYPEHLTSPEMLDILRHVDVQLVVNGSALEAYAREGIPAAFCPFGYEAPIDPLPHVPFYDVVFLGNNYSEKRQQLYEVLRGLDCSVGIYGSGWADTQGECNYDFATAEALYKNARIAISDNQFPDALGYLSDRPIQVLAAGGALLLQQRVLGLEDLTALRVGMHYMPFDSLENLPGIVEKWLRSGKDSDRRGMVERGQQFVQERHLWGHRVEQLVNEWLPELQGERV